MRVALSLFLAAIPALATARNVVTIGMTGGWKTANVTEANTKLLGNALSGDSYAESVTTRVCYSEVTALETQVVAGTNYRFHISGCDVTDSDGACSKSTLKACKPAEFVVKVFEQTWTQTLKVTAITEVESSRSSDSGVQKGAVQIPEEMVVQLKAAGMAEDEKKAVDAWIQANGLNQYGDDATRMYTGGTPLFDENTGTSRDRYEYILSHHPDRPWLAESAQTTTLFATETKVEETQGQGSVAGVFAMLGLFTVVLAGVAVLKMHQGRRERFRYNPIHSREQ
ncbi:Protease inhibitor EpiC4 [Phytophthora cinnamomi]|uniref:Protease inhibitor EpiC4 n=1 Tax=Phytophthora cinnamomi TaxID=4785 RepID=UPI003559371B|nr:Protease inhibitor EpiC4 [Phytophthora cinnamomi]